MSEDRKSRYISYLVDRVNETELDKKAMELVLEDFLNAQQAMKEELTEIKKAQLAFAKKNKFGKKQQKMTKCETDKSCEEDPDRTDEKEKFDGTDDTLETQSISAPSDTPEPQKEKQRDLNNRPDTYNPMGVHGKPMEHLQTYHTAKQCAPLRR